MECDNGEKGLTLNFPVGGIYTVVFKSNPGRGFQGVGEAGNIRKIYARLGGWLDNSLSAHDWKR